MKENTGFNWAYFILGILFIFVSLISFRDPTSSLVTIVYVFAITAILKGIFELFVRRKLHEYTNQKSTMLIVLGIFDLLVGILLLFNISAGLVALPFVFAGWFLVDSIAALVTAGVYKERSSGYYWFHVIVNILGILLGIMLLFNPISSALTLAFLVGFYFMIIGISLIVYAF
ncbi:HdeD family acid-resistance protein [Enterococcus sp. DIV0876]|uniref:HdeD family acid-resistance protein n=1 Tax=Enterococcus sp. DIV0876 TaxID=2774633 RepID=UPI003D2FEC8A